MYLLFIYLFLSKFHEPSDKCSNYIVILSNSLLNNNVLAWLKRILKSTCFESSREVILSLMIINKNADNSEFSTVYLVELVQLNMTRYSGFCRNHLPSQISGSYGQQAVIRLLLLLETHWWSVTCNYRAEVDHCVTDGEQLQIKPLQL